MPPKQHPQHLVDRLQPVDPVGTVDQQDPGQQDPALLAGMGLSPVAEQLYRRLIEQPLPLTDLRLQAATVEELLAAGLAYRNEDQLIAMPARLAVERWVAEQDALISQVRLGALQYRFLQRQASGGFLEVIHGVDRVREAFDQLQLSAQEQLRTFDREPYLCAPGAQSEVQPEVATGGVVYRTISQREMLLDPAELKGVQQAMATGEKARSFADLPVRMVIADHAMALLILPYGDGPASGPKDCDAVLIHSSTLLDAVVRLFEMVWELSVPIHPGTEDVDGSDEQRQLVRLLAAGLTETAIARELGVSERTVQRRIGRLSELLGADTRFLLGVQASRRGWI